MLSEHKDRLATMLEIQKREKEDTLERQKKEEAEKAAARLKKQQEERQFLFDSGVVQAFFDAAEIVDSVLGRSQFGERSLVLITIPSKVEDARETSVFLATSSQHFGDYRDPSGYDMKAISCKIVREEDKVIGLQFTGPNDIVTPDQERIGDAIINSLVNSERENLQLGILDSSLYSSRREVEILTRSSFVQEEPRKSSKRK